MGRSLFPVSTYSSTLFRDTWTLPACHFLRLLSAFWWGGDGVFVSCLNFSFLPDSLLPAHFQIFPSTISLLSCIFSLTHSLWDLLFSG